MSARSSPGNRYPILRFMRQPQKGILPLVKCFIEECGLSVDEPTPGGSYTPLTFACEHKEPVSEAVLIPVIKYLLENGVDATRPTGKEHTAEEIATISELDKVRRLLVLHRRIKQVQRMKREKLAQEAADVLSFDAKQREADAAAQALLAELDAEDAPSGHKKGKKGKLRKSGGTRQEPHQGEKKNERDEEKEDGAGKEDKEGKIDGSRTDEERTQHDGHEQRGCQQKEEDNEAIIADVAVVAAGLALAAASGGMTLAEGEGDKNGEPKSSATSAALVLTEDDIWEVAPDEYK